MEKKQLNFSEASAELKRIMPQLNAEEISLVANPSYIYQPFDIYIMTPKITCPLRKLLAIVKDMDGTTTTTEPLCLHSLEYMLRRISGRMSRAEWGGLDREKDYPHIIGNSTTKHVEYLLHCYHDDIKRDSFLKAYIHSAIWTVRMGKDKGRQREVRKNLVTLGLNGIVEEPSVKALLSRDEFDDREAMKLAAALVPAYKEKFLLKDFNDEVRAAIDIYYQRYHHILSCIDKGEDDRLAKELGLPEGRHLIEPMPGVAIFLAAVKGWLGAELEGCYSELVEHLVKHPKTNYTREDFPSGRERLRKLGEYLAQNPAKVGVVTSSILYEANIVLQQVFTIMRHQIKEWRISEKKKEFLLEKFSSYEGLYDAVITATDSSEIRLKPHRDLYSLALYQLGITPAEFGYCIGFEDSESGCRAIRAAGIGLCVAVPFADTEGHDLSVASFVLYGGLPEVILKYNLFCEL